MSSTKRHVVPTKLLDISRYLCDFNPSYAVGVIFYDFLVFFGTLIDVFPGILEYVEFKTACSPDQVT